MNLSALKPYIPEFILNARKRFLKKRTQAKLLQDIRRREQASKLSQVDFQNLLRDVGIQAGDCVLVHSGLGSFNVVEGGAPVVLQSLESTVGPEGNLVFPAFPDWWKTVSGRLPFDQKNTATTMGTLAELFRTQPGVKRSLHPTHSLCALGPKADWLVGGHENSPYAFDRSSPYFKICLLKGKILVIGLSMRVLTSIHVTEDLLMPHLWQSVYEPEKLEFEMIPEGQPRFHYLATVHRIAKNRDIERLRPALIKAGALHSLRTDYAEIFTLDSRGLLLTSLRELLNGWSIYGRVSLTSDQRQHTQTLLSELQREFEKADAQSR